MPKCPSSSSPRSRLEHQRAVIEAETKRAIREASAAPAMAAESLKPWRP
ncbi:hypothetical protein [Actinacidiphila soli]|nr:hypothetical protein [Actinacidiphila soli]